MTNVRARLTLIGLKREGKFEEVLLSRSRYIAPASQSLRFYREYFKPKSEIAIEKDRQRWLIQYKDTEFFVNLDQMKEPQLGYYLEIKSRTWSRKDAELKAQLASELLSVLGASSGETVTEDYIDIVSEDLNRAKHLENFLAAICAVLFIISSVSGFASIQHRRKAFNAATYKQAFADQGLYQRIPAMLASTLNNVHRREPECYSPAQRP